jgi:hypothetical protein
LRVGYTRLLGGLSDHQDAPICFEIIKINSTNSEIALIFIGWMRVIAHKTNAIYSGKFPAMISLHAV